MTTFDEAKSDIAETLEALNETNDANNQRLLKAEGRIFALTYVVRDLLSLVDPDAVTSRLKELRENTSPEGDVDPSTQLFFESVRELFDDVMASAPPAPPTIPRFTVIKGGKT